jgi:glycerol-3-phosphate acyltransferase PlsY
MGIALAVFLLVAGLTRMVSAGSVAAAIAFPIAAGATGLGVHASIWATVAGFLIVIRHHENLRRILRGEERKIGAPRRPPGDGAIGERP